MYLSPSLPRSNRTHVASTAVITAVIASANLDHRFATGDCELCFSFGVDGETPRTERPARSMEKKIGLNHLEVPDATNPELGISDGRRREPRRRVPLVSRSRAAINKSICKAAGRRSKDLLVAFDSVSRTRSHLSRSESRYQPTSPDQCLDSSPRDCGS